MLSNYGLFSKITAIFLLGAVFCALAGPAGTEETDFLIKNRKPYGKTIRTRMPPQLIIENLQKELQANQPRLQTFWQNFVVENDEKNDEFVIVARSAEKLWAFGLLKPDCPKPQNYDELADKAKLSGTPVRLDAIIGVKKKRSWFRYVIQVYEPMYSHWQNPCYEWSLPADKNSDKFYKENYTLKVYSENLRKKIYDVVGNFSNWKPPKEVKKIPAMKGSGQDLMGGEADELTDEEKALPLDQQMKILERKRLEKEKGGKTETPAPAQEPQQEPKKKKKRFF